MVVPWARGILITAAARSEGGLRLRVLRRLGSPSSHTRKPLLASFVAKVAGVALVAISIVSGVLGILQVIGPRYLILVIIILLALCGWAAALYVSYADKDVRSDSGQLLKSISNKLPIAYLETWMRSTLLNAAALELYWHADEQLAVREITCDTILQTNDAELRIGFKGYNDSRQAVPSCPMIMFGGSVINLSHFRQKAVSIADDLSETKLYIRNVLDLGQFHFVEVMFPVPIDRRVDFHVEHRHAWPGGMADGEDTLWYPYAALFGHEPDRMVVSVTFTAAPAYLRGVYASMKSGTCEICHSQPRATEASRKKFEWLIDPVDNDCIYGLVFDRGR